MGDPTPGKGLYRHPTVFEVEKMARDAAGLPPHAPCASRGEWEFTKWIVDSGISQEQTDKLLKTDMCKAAAPQDYSSYRNNKTFLDTVDSLPGPRASWNLIEISITGNRRDAKDELMTEVTDCWARNPVDIIVDLLGNPEFANCTTYAPYVERLQDLSNTLENATEDERDRIISEMASADWWNQISREICKTHPNTTIAPVMFASDKTQLSTLSGDKQAYPVYVTVANISKDVRRKPSARAVALLGYLPVTKLECFKESDRSLEGYRLFHFAMRQILQPLVEAGKRGIHMTCADGYVRHVFPILAAYIADFPEQCLVCCNKENWCPTCLVDVNERGELLDSCYRDPAETLEAMANPTSAKFDEYGIRDVPEPFWADLPYANIFGCIVPDLLHQLHKGVFKTHLVKWVSKGREDELDARFARVPPYPRLRVFSKGISKITQWTGNEFRQMEKVFLGLIEGLHSDPRVMVCARVILRFIYLAHYPSHTLSSLKEMRDNLELFHSNKQVFIDLGIRDHFNIPKLHWISHYVASIYNFGTCDGLSTEISECLHIDFAKMAYRASNRRAYIKQMVVWLSCREKVRWFHGFLEWCDRGCRPPAMVEPSRDRGQTAAAAAPVGSNTLTDLLFGPYSIARRPGLGFQTGHSITAKFSASSFVSALETFLRREGLPGPKVTQDSLLNHTYPVFNKFSRTLPSLRGVASENFHDTVSAIPADDKHHAKTKILPRRLVSKVTNLPSSIHAFHSLTDSAAIGYRVGRVRALFSLPPALQRLRTDADPLFSHLAYVELYTPFTEHPEPHSKLYTISWSYAGGARKAAVIPVSQIFRSCHLLPKCGERINRAWKSDTILDECDDMFLNTFSDHHMFLFVE
ncbi:hypothetical protein LXA43DRAFT_907812 [Ganoderma leucocontextum]|nr:hypothetical protein LXA43DRAFT_907812 [Ganoderma leucocontextum]